MELALGDDVVSFPGSGAALVDREGSGSATGTDGLRVWLPHAASKSPRHTATYHVRFAIERNITAPTAVPMRSPVMPAGANYVLGRMTTAG